MIVIAIIGILFAILIPSFINAMDRSRYRACLAALSSVKTAMEILRTETSLLGPTCISGATINDCIAEEIIGMIGATWAVAADLDTRIRRSCEEFGGAAGASTWTCGTEITVFSDAEYDIKGHSASGFNECDICVSEVDYAPQDAQTCLSGAATACP